MKPDSAKADMIGIDNKFETLRGFSGRAGAVVAQSPLVLASGIPHFLPLRLLGRV
jgi:hypothetical protein